MSLLQDAASMILKARHLAVFTGAGISTPSGIPDFRSAETGLWHQDEPMAVASLSVFKRDPNRFFDWYRPLLHAASTAQPNAAHVAVANLERLGIVRSVVTQNIDCLHQAAGSQKVIELHGSMNAYLCTKCGKKDGHTDQVTASILSGNLPSCGSCGGVLKPGITLFEEALPRGAWEAAEQEMENADILLIVGTSLEVMPASSLPRKALQLGARLILINLTSTALDNLAEICIREDAAKALPEIQDLVFEGMV